MIKLFYKFDYVLQKIFTSFFFSLPFLNQFNRLYYTFRFHTKKLIVKSNVVITCLDIPGPNTKFAVLGKSEINNNCEIDISGGVTIGNNVVISPNVIIQTHAHIYDKRSIFENVIKYSNLVIEDEVWICNNVIITASVSKIGRGAVIACGSVVTKNVNSFEIVGGVPAKFIKHREEF